MLRTCTDSEEINQYVMTGSSIKFSVKNIDLWISFKYHGHSFHQQIPADGSDQGGSWQASLIDFLLFIRSGEI